MTNNEIIKALECCKKDDCDNCPNDFGNCYANLAGYSLALINRQKEEIRRLKEDVDDLEIKVEHLAVFLAEARHDAVKEFAEELKKDISWHRTEMYMNGLKGTPRTHEITYETVEEYIDNLVKEFTEGG